MKNVGSFIETCFHWKRGCIKMRKHAERFNATKGYKLAFVVVILTSLFSKEKFVVGHFICTKTRPFPPLFFIRKWIISALSFIWLEINDHGFSLIGPVFTTGLFFLRSSVRFRILFLDNAYVIYVYLFLTSIFDLIFIAVDRLMIVLIPFKYETKFH